MLSYYVIGDGVEPELSMSLLNKTFVDEASTALDHHLSAISSPPTTPASQESVKDKPKCDIGKCFVSFVQFI